MMAVNPYTEARARANAEYDERTFKKHMFRLRLDTDQDILDSIEEAKAHGISKNEWLREIFDGSGVSLRSVKDVMESNGIDPDTVNKIIYELKK